MLEKILDILVYISICSKSSLFGRQSVLKKKTPALYGPDPVYLHCTYSYIKLKIKLYNLK